MAELMLGTGPYLVPIMMAWDTELVPAMEVEAAAEGELAAEVVVVGVVLVTAEE